MRLSVRVYTVVFMCSLWEYIAMQMHGEQGMPIGHKSGHKQHVNGALIAFLRFSSLMTHTLRMVSPLEMMEFARVIAHSGASITMSSDSEPCTGVIRADASQNLQIRMASRRNSDGESTGASPARGP